ncbi:MAG TPA: sulfurtransferase [Thermoleophilaceae bacterium]|nr:sulfurtransferase [Thermoleophilaceae bacterium]
MRAIITVVAFGPLVDAGTLREGLGDPDLRVVDCRWKLGDPEAGRAAYLTAHVPGAAFLDLDRDLSAPPGERGRHPLPAAADFERAARAAGISAGSRVVAYDENASGGAARLWWLLRHFGHEAAAVLDGGIGAWREAGGELTPGEETHRSGDFTAAERPGDTADAEEIERSLADRSLSLVDARARERYAGETEPVDPAAGHIPGAGNAPFAELAPAGRFQTADELRERLDAAAGGSRGELVAYCGSGVSACTLVLAAELAGIDARLYPGSWSEWCARGLPVETSGNAG